jgi:hypothetical protein
MQVLTYIYVFAVWCVATILLRVVSRFEPNARLAFVLRFLIIATGAASNRKPVDALASRW